MPVSWGELAMRTPGHTCSVVMNTLLVVNWVRCSWKGRWVQVAVHGVL